MTPPIVSQAAVQRTASGPCQTAKSRVTAVAVVLTAMVSVWAAPADAAARMPLSGLNAPKATTVRVHEATGRVVDVRRAIGGIPGVNDDFIGLQRITSSLNGSPTTLSLSGDFRIGRGAGRFAGLLIEKSNVTLRWAPGARLLMDNLNTSGLGDQAHGIVVRGNVTNVDLGNFDVEWATKPKGRSQGDGVRIDGAAAVDPVSVPRNIRWGSGIVRKSPQTGVIVEGAGAVEFDRIRVEDSLADGVHFNANYVGPVGNRVEGVNNGDDALAFVTYQSDKQLTAYGDGLPPFTSPDLRTRNNNGTRIGSVYAERGSANAVRLNGIDGVHIGSIDASRMGGAALMVDSTIASGTTYGWSVLPSRHVLVGSVFERGCWTGLTVLTQNVPEWENNERGRFGIHVQFVDADDSQQYDLYVESARGVQVDKIIARGEIRIRNFRDVTLGTVAGTAWLNVIGSSVGYPFPLASTMPRHNLKLGSVQVRKADFASVRGVSAAVIHIRDPSLVGGRLEDVVDFTARLEVSNPNRLGSIQAWDQYGYTFWRVVNSRVDLHVISDAQPSVRSFQLAEGNTAQPAAVGLVLTGDFRSDQPSEALDAEVQSWAGGRPMNTDITFRYRSDAVAPVTWKTYIWS